MSFGKDDRHLPNIGGYGATQTQRMGNASRRQSGPRKGSPSWANNFMPSEGISDYIRLIPGDFDGERIDEVSGQVYIEKAPWFESTEHYHGTMKKGITCSGGIFRMSDRKRAQPCRGCDIWREDATERRRIENETGIKPQSPNRISFSSKYIFYVLDMAWFFKGYRLDEHGRVSVNKNTNQPYMDWIKYNEVHHNEYLYATSVAQQQNRQLEMRHGMVQTWPLGFTQFGTLSGFADVVQKHCKSCGNQNCIHTTGWSCSTCNAPTIESSLPPDEIKKLVSKPLRCRHCGATEYPKAIQTCSYCPNPVPATLYDVDMQVQTVKQQSGRGKPTRQIIFPWMSGPRPVDPQFAEALKKLPDVVKKFAPTPYEEQIALFGHAPGQGQAPAPYGQAQPPQQGWQQPQWGQAPQGYQQPPQAQAWGQPQAPQGYTQQGAPFHGNYQAPPAQPGWGQTPQGGPVANWDGNSPDNNDIPY